MQSNIIIDTPCRVWEDRARFLINTLEYDAGSRRVLLRAQTAYNYNNAYAVSGLGETREKTLSVRQWRGGFD